MQNNQDSIDRVDIERKHFMQITAANLIARSAYQMGKTPLLPLFAASLGAGDAVLGIIVSISTLTGMVLKPFIGVLSDRWGRRIWLLIGTAFFALMPFAYWFVHTPTHLLIVRVIHGTATAIYGPVTLAYVTERWPGSRAERLGWFDAARTVGYIVGPTLAGWLLLSLTPPVIFTIIGLVSCAVFIPVLALPESIEKHPDTEQASFISDLKEALKTSTHTPAVWLSGGLEAVTYVATYAIKAFLPVYAIAQGLNAAEIGLFFSIQEGVNLVAKPFGGRLADKYGMVLMIYLGMALLAVSLVMLPNAVTLTGLFYAAIAIGLSQALIFPSTTALVAEQIHRRNLGAGMGLLGTFRNGGKVIGPILGGLLLSRTTFASTFHVIAVVLIISGLLIGTGPTLRRLVTRKQPKPLDPHLP